MISRMEVKDGGVFDCFKLFKMEQEVNCFSKKKRISLLIFFFFLNFVISISANHSCFSIFIETIFGILTRKKSNYFIKLRLV